MIGERQIAS